MSNTPKTPENTTIAYKGFDKDFKCRGFQYEVGGEYTHEGKVKACEGGFHACENPLDVFRYYLPTSSRFALVEQSGELSHDTDNTKVASRRIKIGPEIGVAGLVIAAVDYLKRSAPVDPKSPAFVGQAHSVSFADGVRCAATANGPRSCATITGKSSAAVATGHNSAAIATSRQSAVTVTGDNSVASATGEGGVASALEYGSAAIVTGGCGAAIAEGDRGIATVTGICSAAKATGDCGAAIAPNNYGGASVTGDRGVAVVGGAYSVAEATGSHSIAVAIGECSRAAATGDCGVAVVTAISGMAKGAEGCILFLSRRTGVFSSGPATHAKAVIVGQDGVLPDTWYRLNQDGELETVE